MTDDARWMQAALALSERGRGRTAPNPCVGCVIVREGIVVGRGWTQPAGRPHAEAMALRQAGEAARGATAYVTLEPCALPGRGPPCAGELIRAGVARVVAAIGDPFPAVDGAGFRALAAAGVSLTVGVRADEAARAMAGFLTRQRLERPHVTLKLALSLDGAAAMADGRSRWITGPEARAHAHLERSRHETILVGRGTWEADRPTLDVRLEGLEGRSPQRWILSARTFEVPDRHAGLVPASTQTQEQQASGVPNGGPRNKSGVTDEARSCDESRKPGVITDPRSIPTIPGDHLLVEGGLRAAASFLAADLVDRLLLYRAPILIGGGRTLPDIGLGDLADAHGRWALADARALGSDRLEVYERRRS